MGVLLFPDRIQHSVYLMNALCKRADPLFLKFVYPREELGRINLALVLKKLKFGRSA